MSAFICPNCKKKQPINKLFLLSNFSQWRCPHCNKLLKPRKMATYTFYIGLFATVIPGYLGTYVLKYNFIQTMLLAFTGGVIALLIAHIYYYFNAKFEEV